MILFLHQNRIFLEKRGEGNLSEIRKTERWHRVINACVLRELCILLCYAMLVQQSVHRHIARQHYFQLDRVA